MFSRYPNSTPPPAKCQTKFGFFSKYFCGRIIYPIEDGINDTEQIIINKRTNLA
jgi:hypothetical protein